MHQYRYSIADLEVLESKKAHISNWIFLCFVFILNGNGYPEASSTAAEGDPLTSRNCRINRNTFTDKAARPSDLKTEPDEEADRNDYECGWEHIFSERQMCGTGYRERHSATGLRVVVKKFTSTRGG